MSGSTAPTAKLIITLKTSLQLDLAELKRAIDLGIVDSTTEVQYETSLISKKLVASSTSSRTFTSIVQQSEFSTPLVTIQINFLTPGHQGSDTAVKNSIVSTVRDFVTPKVLVTKVTHASGGGGGEEPPPAESTQAEIAQLRLYMNQFTYTLSKLESKL